MVKNKDKEGLKFKKNGFKQEVLVKKNQECQTAAEFNKNNKHILYGV